MQLEKELLNNEYIELEIERIKLLFEKRQYNKLQKMHFIDAKLMGTPSKEDIQISKKLLEEIE